MRLIALFLFLLPVAAGAQNVPKLVPDVSQREINIQSGFTGAEQQHLPARRCARGSSGRRRGPARANASSDTA